MIKFKEYYLLQESNSKTLFAFDSGWKTFGDALKEDSMLNKAVKDMALEYEWAGEAYNALKMLKADQNTLDGKNSSDEVFMTVIGSPRYAVILHFTGDQDEPLMLMSDPHQSYHWKTIFFKIDHIYYALSLENTHNMHNEIDVDQLRPDMFTVKHNFDGVASQLARTNRSQHERILDSYTSIEGWVPFI